MLYNKFNLAVAKFAADEGREEFKCVLFTKDKTVATDGVRLLEVSVNSALKVEDFPQVNGLAAMRGCSPFLVGAKQVTDLKLKGAKGLPITEMVALKHVDNERVEFLTTDLESSQVKQMRRVDGKFPDYEQIFPKDDPVAEVSVNGVKMAELLKVIGEMGDATGTVCIRFYGANKPIELRVQGVNQQARGMMMPMRE